MTSLARWCYRNRWIVLSAWLVALIASLALSMGIGSHYDNDFNLPGTDSQRASDLLNANFPAQSGDLDTIVLHTRTGQLTDPAARTSVTAMLAKVATLPHVVSVVSPYTAAGTGQINANGTIGYANVMFDKSGVDLPTVAINRVITTATAIASPSMQVALGGQAIGVVNQPGIGLAELIGVAAAAIILFLAFGSWRGMIMPLITALMAVGIGTSLIAVLSRGMSVAPFATELASLIGIGVGVDYALFIVSRHRNNLLHGMSVEDSVAAALSTSGRAVLFAGATVCVALLGLILMGVTLLVGVSLGAAITVALTMLTSLTLLPALLGFMGPKVLGRRQLARLVAHGPNDSHVTGKWMTWARVVERRRTMLAIIATAVVVMIGLPALGLRLGASDQGNDPKSLTTRQAYDLLAHGFGAGFNGPLDIVVSLRAPGDAQTLAHLQATLKATPGVATVSPATFSANHETAVFAAIPVTSPEAAATSTLVSHLRGEVIPAAIAGTPIRAAYIAGDTAGFIDFAHVLASKLPLFVGVVIGVAFLLLLLAFRSLVIPLVASFMNVLAAAASFGLLVFVFQQGHLGSLFSIGRPGPIDAFLPVMLFAILFGLSMDYQVFLVSRMHEEWIRTGDNKRAVTVGQAETGRVITAAASIMIVVFMAFVFAGQRVIGEFGLGLSGAVLLDAFVLRTVLVPAVMHGLGRANWYLPVWLDRVLPQFSIESAEPLAAPVPEQRHEAMDAIDEIVATSLFDVELDDHVGA
jgi:RND superfamily putative drug exporter